MDSFPGVLYHFGILSIFQKKVAIAVSRLFLKSMFQNFRDKVILIVFCLNTNICGFLRIVLDNSASLDADKKKEISTKIWI